MNSNQEYFKIRYRNNGQRNDVWKSVVRWLEKTFGKGDSVLEVAAGRCSIINAASAKEKWAIDVNPDLKTFVSGSINTKIGDAIENPYMKKLILDIQTNGLDYPVVGVEGNHRALAFWYLQKELPYLEMIRIK